MFNLRTEVSSTLNYCLPVLKQSSLLKYSTNRCLFTLNQPLQSKINTHWNNFRVPLRREYGLKAIGGEAVLKFRKAIGYEKMDYSRMDLKFWGTQIFIRTTDSIDIHQFFKVCNLEDTFASWFGVIELHMWILSSRLMEDGKEGKYVRNSMLKAFWKDVEARSKKLEGIVSSARRQETAELGEQFNTQMISYDEGIHSDMVLTGALWRRFLTVKPKDQQQLLQQVKALELLLAYTRIHCSAFHKLSREELIIDQKFKWRPFNHSILDL